MAELNKSAAKYFHNCLLYARRIKGMLAKDFPDIRVLVFGSAARGDYGPGSDIDILIISSKVPKDIAHQAAIKVKIKKKFPDAPFEIHLASIEEYENWYKKFIKDDFKEV